MKIYDVLRKDHENVKELLSQLLELGDSDTEKRHKLVKKIRDDLIPHSRAEEAVFYNTIRSVDAAKEMVMHGYQEHLEAETYLRMLQLRDKVDVEWKNTALKLQSAVEHHIEQEEREIFGAAEKLFTPEEAEMMGQAFEKLKPEIKEEGIVETTLDLVINMMPPRFTSAFRKGSTEFRL